MTTTKQLRRWLISVARPVLKPLGASIVFRHVDQLAGLALLAISAGAVTKVAGNALGAPASETAWLPNPAAMLAVVLATVSLVKGLARYLEHLFGHLVAFKALELLRVRLYQALSLTFTPLYQSDGAFRPWLRDVVVHNFARLPGVRNLIAHIVGGSFGNRVPD